WKSGFNSSSRNTSARNIVSVNDPAELKQDELITGTTLAFTTLMPLASTTGCPRNIAGVAFGFTLGDTGTSIVSQYKYAARISASSGTQLKVTAGVHRAMWIVPVQKPVEFWPWSSTLPTA